MRAEQGALDLVDVPAEAALELAAGEAQRGDAGLEAMQPGRAGLGEADEDLVGLEVGPFGAAGDDVVQQPADAVAEIERDAVRAGVVPGLAGEGAVGTPAARQ